MLEVDRDLAHKVFDLLEGGKTPYAVAEMGVTSARTAQRLKAALEGSKAGDSDNDISRTTGWRAERVALIRRWWKERLRATEQSGADIELGPHARELFYFGQRFRDLLSVPVPHEVVAMTKGEYKGAMWAGWPYGDLAHALRYAEEEAVAKEWGSGRRDARTHSQFSGFHQHLFGHGCWESLDHVKSAYNDYGEACRQANEAVVDVVSKRIRGTSSNAADGHADAIARALLADGLYRKRTGRNLVEPRKEQEADGWLLHLGPQFCRVNSLTEADALAKTYKELRESLLHNAELSAIAKAQEQVEKAMADFRASLPESLLRKLVLNGRCEWCP